MGGHKKKQSFTVCDDCGSWVYNWRLDRQGYKCTCGRALVPYGPSKSGGDAAQTTLVSLLQTAGLQGQAANLAKQLAASLAPAQDEGGTSPWKRLQQARVKAKEAADKEEKAHRLWSEAEALLEQRQQEAAKATEDAFQTQEAAQDALRAFNRSQEMDQGQAEPQASSEGKLLLGFSGEVFQDIDEYQEDLQKELVQVRDAMLQATKEIEGKHAEMLVKVRAAKAKMLPAAKKRRSDEEGAEVRIPVPEAAAEQAKPAETAKNPAKAKEDKEAREKHVASRLADKKQSADKDRADKQAKNPTPAEAAELQGNAGSAAGAAAPGVAGAGRRGGQTTRK